MTETHRRYRRLDMKRCASVLILIAGFATPAWADPETGTGGPGGRTDAAQPTSGEETDMDSAASPAGGSHPGSLQLRQEMRDSIVNAIVEAVERDQELVAGESGNVADDPDTLDRRQITGNKKKLIAVASILLLVGIVLLLARKRKKTSVEASDVTSTGNAED